MVTLYLKRRGKPVWFTGIPAIFMMGSTLVSMVVNLRHFILGPKPDYLLGIMGSILFLLGCWLVVEAILVFTDRSSDESPED